MRIIDLKGEVFGRLTVVSRAPNAGGRDANARWNCRCDCGRMVVAYGQDLRKHKVVSCGCWNAEKRTKHGLARTPEYRVFMAMKMRCENPNDASWHNYGGRGITVDPRWASFPQFWEDMGPRPSPRSTLERIDNNKSYGPDNCRWATYKEQLNNRRTNHVLEHEGEKLTLAQWAERLGVSYSALHTRLSRSKSPDVFNRPIKSRLCPHCGKPIAKAGT